MPHFTIQASYIGTMRVRAPSVTEFRQQFAEWKKRSDTAVQSWSVTFNMNPFEDAIVAATGLNAVMDRMVAARRTRTVLAHEYPFFYNPMWGHFGDSIEGPSGTFYDGRSEHVTFFWNMFDQVLIRPELLSMFRNEDLKILGGISETSLLTANGLPNASVASDHLPILFRLDL